MKLEEFFTGAVPLFVFSTMGAFAGLRTGAFAGVTNGSSVRLTAAKFGGL